MVQFFDQLRWTLVYALMSSILKFTYTRNEHPKKQHDVELEEQDIPSLAKVRDDFPNPSEEPIAFVKLFFGAVVSVCGVRHVVVLTPPWPTVVFRVFDDCSEMIERCCQDTRLFLTSACMMHLCRSRASLRGAVVTSTPSFQAFNAG